MSSDSTRVGGQGVPVAPDSVRVWRGFKRDSLREDAFFRKLGSIFIPATVQIQARVGLAAYLPTVLPRDKHPSAPDEIALVFYEYQGAYDEAKQTVGGRAYSDLHGLVFDLDQSLSGFPGPFAGTVRPDERYHLFTKEVDWQTGVVNVFVGVRADGDAAGFLGGIAEWLGEVQAAGDRAPDGAIAAASTDYVVYWEHWPDEAVARHSRIARLAGQVQAVYQESIPPYTLSEGLWDSFPGVDVKGGASFNFQFPRRLETAPLKP